MRAGNPNVIMVIADTRLPAGDAIQGRGVSKSALEGAVRALSVAAMELKARVTVSIDGGARGCLFVPGIVSAMLGAWNQQEGGGGSGGGVSQHVQRWEANAWSKIPLENLDFTYTNSCRVEETVGNPAANLASLTVAVSSEHPRVVAPTGDAMQEICNVIQLLALGPVFKLMACSASSDSATLGVLAQEPIPKGSVVCEFVGEVRRLCGDVDEGSKGGGSGEEGSKRPACEVTTTDWGSTTRYHHIGPVTPRKACTIFSLAY